MNSYILDAQSEEARRWKTVRYACFGLLILHFSFFIFFWRNINFLSGKLMFSLSVSAVAGILAGTYFYTHRFLKDPFYFFVFLSWLANAFYLIPELNGPTQPDAKGYFSYKIGVYVLSLISSILLVPALLSPGKKKSTRWTYLIGVAIGTTLLAVDCYLIIRGLPEGTANWSPVHTTLAWILLPGSVLSFALIWAAGEVSKARLSDEDRGWKRQLLPGTFYIYAVLQFIYPVSPFLETLGGEKMLVPFFIAQLAKVGNAISMLGVLQSAIAYKDLRRDEEIKDVRIKEAELKAEAEQIEKKSQFIELGMLASSIKHDVNTPLATMSFDIGAMKNRFQHDTEIIKKLERLEESMERIYAIVKVVDILRGDKAFFDRDQFMSKTSIFEVVHRAVRSVKNEKSELKLKDSKNTIKVEGREIWGRAYSPMLEQVVVNIIKNSLEAISEAGRERGLIMIRVGSTEIPESNYSRWVKIEISDNGCGIPEKNIGKLTTLFTTRDDKKPNSGIGLFIGKKILDIHNGEIKFESKVGEGTKVTLLLPEWNALQKAEETHQSAERITETNGSPALDIPVDKDVEAEVAHFQTTETSEVSGEPR
ncbi:MAG TPA: HAMP domain-containing sensor histidine kinase [Pyrinomonadaceae bacterium]|jgi:signal transduction histidine kinase